VGVSLILSISTSASVVVPGDVPYYRLIKGDVQYVYDQDTRNAVAQLTAYQEHFRRMYDKSYGWRLSERQDLILTSSRQQVANAYATTIPNIKSVWYPSGADFMDGTATSSWMLTLAAHETAHLYQLDAKGNFPNFLHHIFGNTPYVFFGVLPFWISPNFMTPTFLLEGNAVLNESRVNQGGRLYSGEARALVLSQIQAGQIDPNRLINDQFRFPFDQNPYLQGAYFQAHLAAKHGIEKTNQFFVAQGDHWLWPWILNKTFRNHFGASYPQEIREYTRGLEALAKKQKFTPGTPLVSGIFVGGLNHDANRIWFLSSNGVQHPELKIFDKKSKSFTTQQLNLSIGKVFFDGEKPLVADSQKNDLHHITYSLYGEDMIMDERYKGQIVTDQRAGKTAALDAREAWLETRVLVDGVPYDVAHSSAILDEAGNVYYFRQNGAQRVLYKNREPVFKFDGFYGKLMEVEGDGTVYFIGATDYGSTVYRYKNKVISRVLASDRVVDARLINDQEFLVNEIGADGHTVHLVAAEVKPVVPATYSYGFSTENVVPEKTIAPAQIEADERSYNAFGALRYSSMMTYVGGSSNGLDGGVDITFADPMEYHAIGLAYSGTQFRSQAALFAYTFTKYLADIGVTYRYKEEWWERAGGLDQRAYNQDASLLVKLPVWRHGLWDAAIGSALTYELEDAHNDPDDPVALAEHPDDREEYYGIKSGFSLSRTDATPLGMYAWRGFTLDYSNHLKTQPNLWQKEHNTSLVSVGYQHGFPMEFYATVIGHVAWAETKDIDIRASAGPADGGAVIPMITSRKDYSVKNAESARLEIHKVLNLRFYSPRIFIGLDRLAPVVVAQGVFLDDDVDNKYPRDIFQVGVGADLQILLFHRLRAVQRILIAGDSTDKERADTQFRFTLKQDF
jgi:hypothetical protein